MRQSLLLMRTPALAILLAASASAQTANTQVDGLVLTNGLSTLSDSSAIKPSANQSTGVMYLTDNDATTFNYNIGVGNGGISNGGAIQGTFSGTIGSSATGVYIIGATSANSYNSNVPTLYNGTFSVQLVLNSGLTLSRSYEDVDFVTTEQVIQTVAYYQVYNGEVGTITSSPTGETLRYAYLYVSFSDFSTTYDNVVGFKLSNFIGTGQFPDIGYIGAGYAGAPPIPEPSTYGLMLGGLALVGAVIRRRKISK